MQRKEMRGCEDFLNNINANRPDIYEYICDTCKNAKENGIFVGIRSDKINFYYRGRNLCWIDKNYSFTASKYFLGMEKNKKNDSYHTMPFEEFKSSYCKIRKGIDNYDNGLEKEYQQRIVSTINEKSSRWYCVDMEYNQLHKRVGRFDIIAVSRNRNDAGKHRVALIELKVGTGSYSGSLQSSENQEKQEKLDFQFNRVHSEPHEIFSRNSIGLKFGSGIVGHIADYIRYLPSNGYKEMLIEEIPQILRCQNRIGYPVPENLLSLQSKDFEEKPEVVFLCFSDPDNKKQTVSALKMQFGKFIFNKDEYGQKVSKYSLKSMINPDDVSSFLSKELLSFLKDNQSENNIFKLSQEIQTSNEAPKESFSFSLVFIDSKEENCMSYLDNLSESNCFQISSMK